MKRFLLSSLMILFSTLVFAQSATMLSMARAELDKRGLTEVEVRERLMQDGINPDTISPSDYPKYQGRVMAILDQMQAEKSGSTSAQLGGEAVAGAEFATGSTVSNAVPAPTASSADVPQTTIGEAAAETALEESLSQNNVSPTAGNNIYGHSMFTGQALDVFRTTDGAQAPETYILGEGDEVHISIFGSSQTEIHQRIASDGSIQPAGSTKIFLKGLTLAQGRAAIRSKLSQHYSFRPDQIAVTISTARTVFMSIYGEVGVQGGFTISALNNAFNALAAAGGPTAVGSVRNIQLSRAGKTHRLDLYKYMTNPTVGLPYDIQNNDVIFVPIAQKIVTIEGAVKRPMSYEMIDGEDLTALIEYAGGLTYNAYPEFVQIERMENGEISYQEYKLADVIAGSQKVTLRPGDVVRIKTSVRPLENYVEISGDVYYGGRYDFEKNKSLLGLINKAEPRYTVKKDYVIVERTNPDETVEVITVPFPGEEGNPDFTLQPKDRVTVLELASFRDTENISVNGQVRRPFSRSFGLNDRMTVGQAIELAGGLRPSVFPVAYIVRTDITNTKKKEYIRISLDNDKDKFLQPGDQLNIYDNTSYTNVGEIHISGAVNNSLGTTYDPSLTLHDLIMMAGGFTVGAAYDRVQVFRVNISKTEEVDYDLITLTVDEDYNPTETFYLQPYDHIVVRMTPNYSTDRTVEINGRVKYPGVYVLDDSRTHLSEVIELAGGLLDDADPYTSIFRTYRNRGRIGIDLDKMNNHKKKMADDPILMAGDVLNLNRQENTVVIRSVGTRMNQYTPEDFTTEVKNVVYQGSKTASWYVKHYAGGFDKYADRKSVTVTLPNNQTIATRQFIFRATPKVLPGSVITMRMDQDKIDKRNRKVEEPKNKVDFETVAAKTLSSLTSIISVIILSRNLLTTSK